MKQSSVLFFFVGSLFVIGCGHTNKLAQYKLRAQPFEMYSGSNTTASASSDINGSPHNVTSDIVAGLTSGSLSQETTEKLRRAANSDSLAAEIGRSFDRALMTYLAVPQGRAYDPKALYRAETQLQSYSLTSDSTGVAAHISATSRIIERSTGILIWQYTSSKDILLTSSSSSIAGARAMMSAVNAATLAGMSEHEMASIFYSAAAQVGSDIAETLRSDVADLSQH